MKKILLLCQVGKKVGLGHLVRLCILKDLLKDEFDFSIEILNEAGISDQSYKNDFLTKEIDFDLIIADGLHVYDHISSNLNSKKIISLSYMSDINKHVDLLVTPALNGQKQEKGHLYDLKYLICHLPKSELDNTNKINKKIGFALGSFDVDSYGEEKKEYLKKNGFEIQFLKQEEKSLSLKEIIEKKILEESYKNFPFYEFEDCDLVITQGGLSALELSNWGMPIIIRTRSDFKKAYNFLDKNLVGVERVESNDENELLKKILILLENSKIKTHQKFSFINRDIMKDSWRNLLKSLTA